MEPEIYYIIAAAAGLGLMLGAFLGRWAGGRAAAGLAGVLILGALVLIAMGQRATGWDGVAYVIGAIVLAAPMAVGAALGGWLGARRRQRRRRSSATLTDRPSATPTASNRPS